MLYFQIKRLINCCCNLMRSRRAVSIFRKAHNTCLTCSSLVKCARVLEWNFKDLIIVFVISDADQRIWFEINCNILTVMYWRLGAFWSNRLLGKCDRVYFWPRTHTHEHVGTFITAGLLSGLQRSRWKWGAQLCASRGLQQLTMTLCVCVCPLMWCSHVCKVTYFRPV